MITPTRWTYHKRWQMTMYKKLSGIVHMHANAADENAHSRLPRRGCWDERQHASLYCRNISHWDARVHAVSNRFRLHGRREQTPCLQLFMERDTVPEDCRSDPCSSHWAGHPCVVLLTTSLAMPSIETSVSSLRSKSVEGPCSLCVAEPVCLILPTAIPSSREENYWWCSRW